MVAKLISAGTVDYRRGDLIRPANAGTIREASKKKELKSPEAYCDKQSIERKGKTFKVVYPKR